MTRYRGLKEREMKNNKKGLWGIIVAIGLFLLSKLKWVFAIFKLAKFSTVFSMFLSLGAYAVLYGWKFGVALIYLLFVHEMGPFMGCEKKRDPNIASNLYPIYGGSYWNERDAEKCKR